MVFALFRACRPAVHPGPHQLGKLRLRAWRGRTIGTGCPTPRDEGIVAHVVDHLLQRALTVAFAITELLAQRRRGTPDPGHRLRRQTPVRGPGHPRQLLVAVLVATAAFHADHASVLRAAHDG